jgi:transposase
METPACPGCRERDARIAQHEARIKALEEEVRQLKALLSRNASNSSVPPSANPPSAPAPVVKEKTGRKPGAQPGHPPHLKQLLPPERVTHVLAFVPSHCQACQAPLPKKRQPTDPEPTRFQVADLPPIRAAITEYQGHTRTCPQCGALTKAAVPQEYTEHSIGPGLAAATVYLAGCHQVSKRGLEEIVETLFDVPVALGTISNLEEEISQALGTAHAEALQAVQKAAAKNVDETGWKKHGSKCWLWVAVATHRLGQVAAFTIHGRGLAGLATLLSAPIRGIVISDRWSAYQHLPVHRRQLCWAHLIRDFQALVDLGGQAKTFGEELLMVADDVFHWWYRVRDGTLSRATLRTYIDNQRPWLRDLLTRGKRSGCAKTATLCKSLLELEPALWTFARHEGVEPTNNWAERALRKAVLWRKQAFGCTSDRGCRFVERILTVVQTLRLQKRSVWRFLHATLQASRAGQIPPRLLAIEG